MPATTHASDEDFATILEQVAAADEAAAVRRAATETWALLAARIALAMAPEEKRAQPQRPNHHLKFVDADVPMADQDHEPLTALPEITARLSRVELERLRRLFAKANHPDRVAPELREMANQRMALFNRMIDEALSRAARA